MGRACRSILLFLTIVVAVIACYRTQKAWGQKDMIEVTPRLKSIFEKTKTVCFGRFLIDVPDSANVVWGRTIIPLEVAIYPGGIDQVKAMQTRFVEELSSIKAINRNYVPLLVSVEDVDNPKGKLVTGYADFEAIDEYKINGYFELNGDGVVINSRPLAEDRNETVSLVRSIAARLRKLGEGEVPKEPGNCIEHAFLSDMPNAKEDDLLEHISIGVRLKEIPDAHFSIYVAPSNPHGPEGDSLETQFKRTFADMTSTEEKRVLANTKIFRQSARQIYDWETGFEVLMRSPDEDGSLSHHDFRMKFVGVPHDVFKPYADIQFQTGVGDNAAGQLKATLTDEEALAVWDKITSTIRVRPTSAAPAKSAKEDAGTRRPLGDLAATGRVCLQTGVWESSNLFQGIEGVKRQHIHAGEHMPHVILHAEPSIWQRLKGEQPSYRTATVWKLVAYDDAPAEIKSVTQAPSIAHSSTGIAAKAVSQGDQESPTPPKKEG